MIDQSYSVSEFPKDLYVLPGKLRTELTSPIAKASSSGLSDTTFFARCFITIYRQSLLHRLEMFLGVAETIVGSLLFCGVQGQIQDFGCTTKEWWRNSDWWSKQILEENTKNCWKSIANDTADFV